MRIRSLFAVAVLATAFGLAFGLIPGMAKAADIPPTVACDKTEVHVGETVTCTVTHPEGLYTTAKIITMGRSGWRNVMQQGSKPTPAVFTFTPTLADVGLLEYESATVSYAGSGHLVRVVGGNLVPFRVLAA